MEFQRWQVGKYTITSVVEEEVGKIRPEFFFPDATAEAVARHGWLVPDFADARGRILMRVQAFVIEGEGRRLIVDPCVGNGKKRLIPFWNERSFPFLERFHEAGFSPGGVDLVLHTHLHADHVGWDTRLEAGEWVPTFPRARYLYTARELEWCAKPGNPGTAGAYDDSIAPVIRAGQSDIVEEDADLGGGLRLAPTTGHTPGHVSLFIESEGEAALVSGDFIHHPVQCAEPAWAEVGDEDVEVARTTRAALLREAARRNLLFLGTHFPGRPAGRIVEDGNAFRFVSEA